MSSCPDADNDYDEDATVMEFPDKQNKPVFNCPNCGAPVSNYICAYCGTDFRDKHDKYYFEIYNTKVADELNRLMTYEQRLKQLQFEESQRIQLIGLQGIHHLQMASIVQDTRNSMEQALQVQSWEEIQRDILLARVNAIQKERNEFNENVKKIEKSEHEFTFIEYLACILLIVFITLIVAYCVVV